LRQQGACQAFRPVPINALPPGRGLTSSVIREPKLTYAFSYRIEQIRLIPLPGVNTKPGSDESADIVLLIVDNANDNRRKALGSEFV